MGKISVGGIDDMGASGVPPGVWVFGPWLVVRTGPGGGRGRGREAGPARLGRWALGRWAGRWALVHKGTNEDLIT